MNKARRVALLLRLRLVSRVGWPRKRPGIPARRTARDLLAEAAAYIRSYYDFIEAGERDLAPMYLEMALELIKEASGMIEAELAGGSAVRTEAPTWD